MSVRCVGSQPAAHHPRDKRTLNKLVVEASAYGLSWIEPHGEPSRRVWAIPKAA